MFPLNPSFFIICDIDASIEQNNEGFSNMNFNDLKFYQLKQRLLYKAFYVPEHYTTKTCSCCGAINNNEGSKEVFECSQCNLKTGWDMNASKNIKMKGFFF